MVVGHGAVGVARIAGTEGKEIQANIKITEDDLELIEKIKEAIKIAQGKDFVEKMDNKYESHIARGGTNVSGGQKQRLCIARALLKKPKIIILDDSTSAVDTATDASIRRAFREELAGSTKIIIAQRISSVQDADKIIIMDKGRIMAVGTHEELLASNEIYQEVYTSQNKGGDDDAE